jgi:hypothetical protein
MARNLLKPRKHAVSAYRNDICIFHRTTDDLGHALKWYTEQVEAAFKQAAENATAKPVFHREPVQDPQAPDQVVFWKGKARKTAFAEFDMRGLAV